MNFKVPKVMGILNVTPDSFYPESRTFNISDIRRRAEKMISDGVEIIDVGGCSTRPGYHAPSEVEEWERVDKGCRIVREISEDIPLSIDTFRASVALKAIEKWGAAIINDVSGGIDSDMWQIVAAKGVAYVLTHNFQDTPSYTDVTSEVIIYLSKKVNELHRMGLNDVIIDPGFGFAKTLDDNFRLFKEMEEVAAMGMPVLVGLSRKSMIYKTLGVTPEQSLAGSIALEAIALTKGADILRVHDVKEAVETIKLFARISNS